VLARFAISKKDRPFLIVVGILGGGGSMSLAVGADGLRQVEGSLEFGATVALTIVGAKAVLLLGLYYTEPLAFCSRCSNRWNRYYPECLELVPNLIVTHTQANRSVSF